VRELALVRFEKDELDRPPSSLASWRTGPRSREAWSTRRRCRSSPAWFCEQLYDQDASFFETLANSSAMPSIGHVDPGLQEVAQRCSGSPTNARSRANFASLATRRHADPGRLDEVEIVCTLRRLETKYGQPIEQLIAFGKRWTLRNPSWPARKRTARCWKRSWRDRMVATANRRRRAKRQAHEVAKKMVAESRSISSSSDARRDARCRHAVDSARRTIR